jgi:2,3-bisphosphoglycerate-dependent phosphoglycerate mutase
MFKLVLLRHGESDWNKENRFTGWTMLISEQGHRGQDCWTNAKAGGYTFDCAFTSVLRAIRASGSFR